MLVRIRWRRLRGLVGLWIWLRRRVLPRRSIPIRLRLETARRRVLPRGSIPIGLRLWVLHGRVGASAFTDQVHDCPDDEPDDDQPSENDPYRSCRMGVVRQHHHKICRHCYVSPLPNSPQSRDVSQSLTAPLPRQCQFFPPVGRRFHPLGRRYEILWGGHRGLVSL